MGNVYVERRKTYLAIRLEEDCSNSGAVADFAGSITHKVHYACGKVDGIELWCHLLVGQRNLYVPPGFYLVRSINEIIWSVVSPIDFNARYEEIK